MNLEGLFVVPSVFEPRRPVQKQQNMLDYSCSSSR